MIPAVDILDDVPLAPRTTLELGGPARFFVLAKDERRVIEALRWAKQRGLRVGILGGGSNLVVGDAGFDGLVVEMGLAGIEVDRAGDVIRLTAAAGEDWDALVERTVAAGWQGLECLSGIPGRVGASPIQNVGAYGQEVSETITSVRALDRRSLEVVALAPEDCAFGYRDSCFKQNPDRYVVLAVTFTLKVGGTPAVRYAELERSLAASSERPSLSTVRDTVIALRRKKSMVLDVANENHRSAGSFFTNPIVSLEQANELISSAIERGMVAHEDDVPRWPLPDGRVKLAAGWLVEHAGMTKGTRHGGVGISSNHALALVHHSGGTTAELMELAGRVEAAVLAHFGVTLSVEPTCW